MKGGRRSKVGRSGMTPIEIIVVLLIIAVLLSIMLPAITAARRASARMNCVNNLKQIILGTHNYHATFLTFPAGVVNPTRPIVSPPTIDDMHIGWIIQILPYIEQGGLAMQLDCDYSVYDNVNASSATTSITSLTCPLDRLSPVPGPTASTSYAACHHDRSAPIDVDNHGVFFLNSRVRIEDITDGLTQTIFVGEKLYREDDLGWGSGTWSSLRNTGSRLNAHVQPFNALDENIDGFESRHPGGANFAFGDGSVRYLKDTIDPAVYRLLGNRADGELLDEPRR